MPLTPTCMEVEHPQLGGGIQLSSSLAECDPALLRASEIYRGAVGLACGKQMVASCSSSLSSSFFSFSLIVLLHISADFAKPPHSFCLKENKCHSSSAQTHTHILVLIQVITQTFHCYSPTLISTFICEPFKQPVSCPAHSLHTPNPHMQTLNNFPVNQPTLS